MKEEKQILIDDMMARLEQSPYLFVADYKGLKVSEITELRKRLRENGSGARVLKNTLVKRAVKNVGLPDLQDMLSGQTMIVTGGGEAPAAAKILKTFSAEFKKPEIKGGVLDGKALTGEDIKALAELPSREELLATLLGVINAPATKLLRTIKEPSASLARVLQAFADKG